MLFRACPLGRSRLRSPGPTQSCRAARCAQPISLTLPATLIDGLFNFRETHYQTLAARVSFSITEDRELRDEASSHCERVREKGFAQFTAPWAVTFSHLHRLGVIRGQILISIFDAVRLMDGAPPFGFAQGKLSRALPGGARATRTRVSNHTVNKSRGNEVESLDFSFL